MTNEEWWNIRPKESYGSDFKFKPEPTNYNIIIEYPSKVITKQEFMDFLKKGLF